MMRCMFSGVSSLRAHQEKMDVIGNNIANVNTVGFKSGRVTFSDVFSQTMSGASAPDSSTGRAGTNPRQIGLGVGVQAIDTIMTRGGTESTGNQTDLAINGNGFFIVRSGHTGSYLFTRAGNFIVDKTGNLTTSDGLNVYGWMDYGGRQQADGTYEFDIDKPVEAINIYSDAYNKSKNILAAKATEYATFDGNLDSSEPAVSTTSKTMPTTYDTQYSTTLTVYDSLGESYEVQVNFTKCFVDNTDAADPKTEWFWEIPASSGLSITDGSGFLRFDGKGNLIGDDAFPIKQSVKFEPGKSVGSAPFTVEIDFTNISMSSADSSVQSDRVDGYPSGTLEDFSIGNDGIIMGVYSNGKQQPLGMIAMAVFDNPAGLAKNGSNTYVATSNSGDFTNGVKVGSEGSGALKAGSLEMSNVDLSSEFSSLIITQRGFQAGSRVITTADEMLQELVNLKR